MARTSYPIFKNVQNSSERVDPILINGVKMFEVLYPVFLDTQNSCFFERVDPISNNGAKMARAAPPFGSGYTQRFPEIAQWSAGTAQSQKEPGSP